MPFPIAVRLRRLIAITAFAGAALMTSSTPAFGATHKFWSRTLYPGMRGSDVRTMQKDLTFVGYKTKATGEFNSATERSVKRFQRHYRLSVDGVVGPQTGHKLLAVVVAKHQTATGASGGDGDGGTGYQPPPQDGPVVDATLETVGSGKKQHQIAVPGQGTPRVIVEILDAANTIATKPYVYGGGHSSFYHQAGYDCSGSVSYALHGGGLLSSPLDSSQFESYGSSGYGRWITLYTNAGHIFMHIAGLWFDTAAQSSSNDDDRWSATRVSPKEPGEWVLRHPTGW